MHYAGKNMVYVPTKAIIYLMTLVLVDYSPLWIKLKLNCITEKRVDVVFKFIFTKPLLAYQELVLVDYSPLWIKLKLNCITEKRVDVVFRFIFTKPLLAYQELTCLNLGLMSLRFSGWDI